MRIRTLLAVPLLLILAIPGHGLAQDAEQAAAPDMEPVMVGVFVDHVRPAMIPEYEAKIAEVVEKFQAAGVDAPAWDGFSSSELGYAYVIPASDLAGWSKVMEAFGSAVGATETGANLAEANLMSDHAEMHFWTIRPDMSYRPWDVGPPDEPYRHYTFWYGVQGRETEVEQLAKDFAALWAAHDLDDPWMVSQAMTGENLPVWLVISSAASQAEYEARDAATVAALGDELVVLQTRALKLNRKINEASAMHRPELSYSGAMETEEHVAGDE